MSVTIKLYDLLVFIYYILIAASIARDIIFGNKIESNQK